jgi:hypothetical protein
MLVFVSLDKWANLYSNNIYFFGFIIFESLIFKNTHLINVPEKHLTDDFISIAAILQKKFSF